MPAWINWLRRAGRLQLGFRHRGKRLIDQDDLDPAFARLLRASGGERETSPKLYSTFKTVEYLVQNGIRGDFVECGVYQGRQVCMMARTLRELGDTSREIYLYDTFSGMTEPCDKDRRTSGLGAEGVRSKWKQLQADGHNGWCYAPLEAVRAAVYATGYPRERFHFVAGDVRQTIPNNFHQQIALLRLDTDWYDLTRHELEHLYPLLTPRGALVIDDYGTWQGARQAVDEYFAAQAFRPLLCRTCKGERVALKAA
jgi:hypothetical protein